MITFHALWSLVGNLPGYNKSEWLALDKQRDFSPLSPEATAEDVAFSAVELYIKQGGILGGPPPKPPLSAQDADRERETQLDAMRATIRRLEAENALFRRADSLIPWLELLSELGVNTDFFDDATAAQAAALSTVRVLQEKAAEWNTEFQRALAARPASTSRPRRAKTVPSRYVCGHTTAEHGPRGGCPKKRSRTCKKQCGCPAMQPHRKGCGYLKTPAGVRGACMCKGKHSARCKARQLAAGVVLSRPPTITRREYVGETGVSPYRSGPGTDIHGTDER